MTIPSCQDGPSYSPLRILLIVLASLFVAEAVVMLLLPILPPLSFYQTVVVDAALLTILGFPLLYFFLFRPLQVHIRTRQRCEEEMRRMNEELEQRVRERTASLEEACRRLQEESTERQRLEERVLQQQKMETVGNLAAGVAHDLNNILSGLVGYPDLLLAELPAGRQRERVLRIKESGERAAAIVDDLLAMARRNVVRLEVVDLNRLIAGQLDSPVAEELQRRFPDLLIETCLEAELPHVLGSPVHLAKSIMNLIINAAEAMPAGGTIQVATGNLSLENRQEGYEPIDPGEYVVVRVADEGVGIDPEAQKRIFEPFFTTKAMARSGTGLGMSMVWASVKDHGGFLDLRSTPGEGTEIALYLPLTRQALASEEPPCALEICGGNERILIVDDLPEQRDLFRAMLARLGYEIAVAGSGEEAVAYLREHRADLVLLDMIMKGMDGLETFRAIREIRPEQKTIIISGYAETDRVRETQTLGAGPYLKKPFSLEKLGLFLRRELAAEKTPAPEPAPAD
jgi:two-component system, cell cycle sensor histidine kinase and response regulator CckA